MDMRSIIPIEGSGWQSWAIPITGLLASLLILFAGRLVFSRRRRDAKEASPSKDPDHDPFDMGSLTERRTTARRKGSPIELTVRNDNPDVEPGRAWVIDRSMGGLCLLLHDSIAAGTVLNVKPTNCPPGTPWVQIEVRNCKQTSDGYEAGCQFLRPPPWAILLLFG
jgi:hypothetical protein